MSSAFVKESEGEWLNDIASSLKALEAFLSRENNGIRAYTLKISKGENGKEIYAMSNGLSYTKDEQGKWTLLL